MMLRYVRHNLRLLLYAHISCFILLAVYSALESLPFDASLIDCNSTDASVNATTWPNYCDYYSVLTQLTLSHVQDNSPRLLAPAILALVFSLAYVYEQT